MYPTLNSAVSSRQVIEAFAGYDHNLRISENAFFDMKNLTSDSYPVLSSRRKRTVYASLDAPAGLLAKDALCYVDGTEFVMGEYRVNMGLSTKAEDCPKRLISMGAYVIILPDKKYINTADLTEFGNIEAEVQTQSPVSFTLCRVDGAEYATEFVQAMEPENPTNMALWVDTSSVPHSLKQWSESTGMWISIASTYIKISSPGIGVAFEQHDGVTISGLKDVELMDSASGEVIVETEQLQALEGSAAIWDKGDDYIVITGILDMARSISNQITLSRKMPNMDFVVECNNRLWGCRYGTSLNGEIVNEIYASKLGDFKNWNCFMGIATDSWVGSLGTDGQFTGAITHLGYPLFFKENVLHKVYISGVGAHSIQDTACRGVQKGCDRSLAIVNEILYYKARHAVCAYDGSLPTEVSYALGEVRYDSAVAEAHGNKYYISMRNVSTHKYSLFVYDTAKGMWHKEDDLQAEGICSCGDDLYCISGGNILAMLGTAGQQEGDVEWMAETGIIGASLPDAKYLSKLTVRMAIERGKRALFSVQYDSMGEWQYFGEVIGNSLYSFNIPLRPRRCDHLRLRIEGKGDVKIYSITKTLTQGSERF